MQPSATPLMAKSRTITLPTTSPPITDVVQFFFAITEKYEHFAEEILKIIHNMPGYSPQQILDECGKIGEQRNRLALMDERMFAIIELAGNEIAQNPMIDEYRVAFARANIACNSLYQKLLALKTTLRDGETATNSAS